MTDITQSNKRKSAYLLIGLLSLGVMVSVGTLHQYLQKNLPAQSSKEVLVTPQHRQARPQIASPIGRQDGGGSKNELALHIPKQVETIGKAGEATEIALNTKERYKEFIKNHPYNTRPTLTKKQMKEMGIPKKDRPDLAAEYDYIRTINPNTLTIPTDALEKARKQTQDLLKKKGNKAAIAGVNWTERGPNNVGGRTRALMFDPNDATRKKVWAGGVAGGLWVNNDITSSATVWQKVDDFWANLAITAIAADPSNSQVMYVGTGEGVSPNHPAMVRGAGIWKTTNGGTSWSQLASTTPTNSNHFTWITKIAVHSSGAVFVATRSNTAGSGGIMRSLDGGLTWLQIYNTASNDIEIASNGDVYIGTFGGVVARTTNPTVAGNPTWTNFNPATGGARVEIAIAPSASSATGTTTLYAIAAANDWLNIQWFRKSTDGGATWSSVTIPNYMEQTCSFGTTHFTRGQAWYDLIMKVRPDNPNVVLLGGIDIYSTSNGGTSWSLLSYWTGGCSRPYLHADQHAIEFRSTNLNEVIFGNDGGVSYSTNAGSGGTTANFSDRNNGYNVTQFYACAMNNTSGSNVYLAGAQDNGTQRFSSAGINSTAEVNGGDGGFCFIDQTNPNIAIASYTNNNFYRSTNGGVTFTTTLIGENSGQFINPADYDYTANVLYTGGNADEMKMIPNIEGTPGMANTLGINMGGQEISTIKANCFTPNRVFVGNFAGDVYRVDNANSAPTVTNITSNLPTGTISSIDVGSSDNELLVTLSNYGISSVFYSTNGGGTWISKDEFGYILPDIPVRWGLFNPNNTKEVMLATELGVWSTSDITQTNPEWGPTNTGLANVRCDMLRFRTSDKQVAVATHGRGLYTTDVWASTPTAFTHTALSPAHNSTNVALNVILSMTFSSNVSKGTGNIVIKRVSDNSILETIAVTSSAVSVSGVNAFIDPTLDLPASTAVYIEVAAGAFKSATNVLHAGFTGNTMWQLTTGAVGGAVANFTISPTSQIAYQPNAFTFTDASTGTITSRSWNFGSGATPATATTVGPHNVTYSTFGLKTVSLTANTTSVSTKTVAYLPTLGGTYAPTDGGNFETDLGHFIVASNSAGTAWERGNSAISGKNGTAGGGSAYVTGLTQSQYPNATETILYTPNYNFSTAGTYTLSFALKMSTESQYDGLLVQYSTNLGGTWTNLGTAIATNWYNSTTLATTNGFPTGTAIFSGTISNFTTMSFNASALAGNANVTFRFMFKSDDAVQGIGAVIDNFQIAGPFVHTNLNPVNGALSVSPTFTLGIGFNSNVSKGTSGSITIKRTSDNTIIETLPITSANITVSGQTAIIDPVNTLPANTQMYVEISAGAFVNALATNHAGFTGNSTWQFTTGAGAATALFTFSQQIIYQPNSVTFTDASTGATSWAWDFGSGATPNTATTVGPHNVTYSTLGVKTVTLGINANASTTTANIAVLPSLPTSYAPTDGGNFETANNHYVSSGNSAGMFFERGNSTIVGKDGVAGGTNAYVTGLTLAQYPNQAQSILYTPNFSFATTGSYTLSFKTKHATEANYDGFIVQYSTNNGSTWTQLGSSMATNWYNSTVASNVGTGGFPAGTALFSGTISTFQTKTFDCSFLAGNANVAFRFVFQSDNTIQAAGVAIDDFQISAPFVATTFSPTNNATNVNVATNLAITFNSAPQKGTGNIIVRRLSDNLPLETMAVTSSNVTISGNTATIDLVNNLPSNTQVYVEITGNTFKNSLGTEYTIGNNTTWRFTTGDGTPPTVVSFSPANNAVAVNPNTNLVITFNESVAKGTGDIVIRRFSDNTIFENIPVSSGIVTVAGAVVTINPTNDLASATQYYVEMGSGAFTDVALNNFAGITGNATWRFTTADVIAPTVVTFNPTHNATGVALNANLVITFSENMQKGAGNIVIKRSSDNSIFETIAVGNANVTVSNAVVTINPTNDFVIGTGYYVEIATGVFKDLANNDYTGFTGNSTWAFTSLDNVAPTVVSFLPTHNATGVNASTNLVMTMSENVQKGTGNIVIKRSSDNSIFETIDVTNAQVSIAGTVVTIDPTANFASGAQYYVEVANGAIKDLANNNFVGFTGNGTWQFTSADVVAPTVVTLVPANNAVAVSTTNDLAITFSENVQKGTGNIVIKLVGDNSVFETINITSTLVTVSGAVVTINPTNNFAQNVQYYVEVASGGITDFANNNFAGITGNSTWRFTTLDSTAPTVASFLPAHNATGVNASANLVMTMSENVQKGTGNIVIKRSSDNSIFETIDVTNAQVSIAGTVVTIDPTANFASGAQYYVEVANGAIKDLSNNNYIGFTGNGTWQFTSADVVAPTAVTFNPVHNATGVALNANLVVTFSENMQKGAGNIVIKRSSDNSIFETIAVGNANVTVSNTVVTINPTNDFAIGTGYYVEIATGAFEDLVGNDYVGFTGNSTWAFTSLDNVAPTVVSFLPTHNATGVNASANLVMTMSENVQKGTGNIVIKRSSDNSIFETIDVTNAQVSIAGVVVTINPTTDFASGAQYYVEIANGAIKDLANNNFVGFTGNGTWQFTSADVVFPTVVTLSPANNAINIAVATDLVITFSENVQKGISGNIQIKRLSDNSVFENINILSTQVTVSGAVVTINPSNNLAVETQYYVEVSSGAIQDLAGNNFAGFTGNATWKFLTLDNNPPTLVSLSPVNGSASVSPTANLVITLSENIQKGTGNILIKRSSDNVVHETINILANNVTLANNVATINPANDLVSGVQYYVEVSSGAIQDLSSNNFAGFAGNSTWQFSVLDAVAPTLVSLSPANNATNILTTANLVMTFNENMQRGSGSISIRRVSNNTIAESIDVTSANLTIAGAVVTINPTNDLDLGVQYFIDVPNGALKDLANNNFAGFTTNTEWRFTTQVPVDITAPLLISTTPINNAPAFAGANNLEMTFNENIQKGTNGSIVIRKLSDGSSVETFGINSTRVTITGSIVTINPVNDLPFNTDLYVEVSNDYFKDLAGNNFAGFSGSTTWKFKTDFSTAVEDDILTKAIQIYPNPTSGISTLEVAEGVVLKQVQASIIDARGALVSTQYFEKLEDTTRLDFTTLPAGKYYLQIRVGNKLALKGFVKVR